MGASSLSSMLCIWHVFINLLKLVKYSWKVWCNDWICPVLLLARRWVLQRRWYFFSTNVSSNLARIISHESGSVKTEDLRKYLDVPNLLLSWNHSVLTLKEHARILYGENEHRRRPHLVEWETVCHSKLDGGIGLRRTRHLSWN